MSVATREVQIKKCFKILSPPVRPSKCLSSKPTAAGAVVSVGEGDIYSLLTGVQTSITSMEIRVGVPQKDRINQAC